MTFGSIANRKGRSGGGIKQTPVRNFRYNFEDYDYSTTKLKNIYDTNAPTLDASVSNTKRVIYGVLENKLYYSFDEGVTFTTETRYTTVSIATMSMNGKYIALLLTGTGGVYVSSDYGVSYTNTLSVTTIGIGIKMSETGKYVTFCGDSYIKVSTDYGQTWTNKVSVTHTPVLYNYQYPIAMSDDGQTQYVSPRPLNSTTGGYRSIDYGNTWTTIRLVDGYSTDPTGQNVSTGPGQFSVNKFDTAIAWEAGSTVGGNVRHVSLTDVYTTIFTGSTNGLTRLPLYWYINTDGNIGKHQGFGINWGINESSSNSGQGSRGMWRPRDDSFTFYIGTAGAIGSSVTSSRKIVKFINYDSSAILLQNNISFTTRTATTNFFGSNYRIVDKYRPILGTRSLSIRNISSDTNGNYVTLPSLITDISGISLSFWIKTASSNIDNSFNIINPNGAKLFWFDDTIGNQFGLSLYSNKLSAHVQNAGVMTQITDGSIYNVALNDGNARHISWVISYNGGGTPIWYFYVNGTLTNTITTNTAYPTATTYTSNFIGCSTAKNDYCEANFDDVRWENKECVQSDITSYYSVLTPVYLGTNMDYATTTPSIVSGSSISISAIDSWTITTTGYAASRSIFGCSKTSTTYCINASQCPSNQFVAIRDTSANLATIETYTDIIQNITFPTAGEYYMSWYASVESLTAYNVTNTVCTMINNTVLSMDFPLPNKTTLTASTSWINYVKRFTISSAGTYPIGLRVLTSQNYGTYPYATFVNGVQTKGSNTTSTTCLANIQVYYYN